MKQRIVLLLICVMCGPLVAFGGRPGFTMWQLASQTNDIGNSYVFQTDKGRIVVVDGGVKGEELYLRGFILALGGSVDTWIVSHPHFDHMGAFVEILKNPKDIKIGRIIQSPMSQAQLKTDMKYKVDADAYYDAIAHTNIAVENLAHAGETLKIDGMNIKILHIADTTVLVDAYNNSSIAVRVWDKSKSVVLLGDMGEMGGQALLDGPYRNDLNCDYLQLAHHGQQGCDENFYRSVRFRACLWSTPLWVWNNNVGEGYNTAWMKTIDTRRWMDEIGITEHYISWQGITKIE